jgi:hypothetical protein
MLAKVLRELMLQAEAKKAQIYEIIGISDIMRGATKRAGDAGRPEDQEPVGRDPHPAAPGRGAALRRDLRLKAEIIAEHFSPQTLAMMTGISLASTMRRREWR